MKCDFCKKKEALTVEPPGMLKAKSGEHTIAIALWVSTPKEMTPVVACLDCLKVLLGKIEK